MPVQTCFRLPVNPSVTHMEGLVLGSEDAGSINPFIVALISQPQSISLLETGYGSEVIGWKSAKSMNTTRRALCVREKPQIPTRCSIQRGNKIGNCCRINHGGSPGLLESLFCLVFFMTKSIKVSSCNHWCQCLRYCWSSSVEHRGQI